MVLAHETLGQTVLWNHYTGGNRVCAVNCWTKGLIIDIWHLVDAGSALIWNEQRHPNLVDDGFVA